MTSETANTKRDLDRHDLTPEVGDEGGTFGNVDTGIAREIGTGSEASETWRPAKREKDDLVRDETGGWRRNP